MIKHIALFLLLSVSAFAFDNVNVNRIIDGDTISVDLPCDIDILCKELYIRVAEVDTPELRGKCDSEREKASEAKRFVEKFIERSDYVNLQECKRGKFYRLICHVVSQNGDLTENLIYAKLGRRYMGGKREGWCDE